MREKITKMQEKEKEINSQRKIEILQCKHANNST